MRAALPTTPLAQVLLAWDAVSIRWGLSDAERGSLMPGSMRGPVCDPSSWRVDDAERRIRLLVRIAELAGEVHSGAERVRWWLRRPNPALSGRAPLEAMAGSMTWMELLLDSLEASL